VSHIPDAEQRLHKCEMNFHQSYGPNLERLLALKGTTGNDYRFLSSLMKLGLWFDFKYSAVHVCVMVLFLA
jgi:hypothetical protein